MNDRVWLITGCSAGFGRHLALAALAAGDRVTATARRVDQLAGLVDAGGARVRTAARRTRPDAPSLVASPLV